MTHFTNRRSAVLAVLGAGGFVGVAFCAATAHAATIQVSTTNTTPANDGKCGLTEAVVAVNTGKAFSGCPAGTGGDAIQLQQAVYTLPAGTGLTLTKGVTISGVPNLLGNGIEPTTISGANLNTGSVMFSLDDSGGKMSVNFQNVQLLGGTSGRGISANGVGNG